MPLGLGAEDRREAVERMVAAFDVDVPLDVVAAVLGGVNALLGFVIFRQPPRDAQ